MAWDCPGGPKELLDVKSGKLDGLAALKRVLLDADSEKYNAVLEGSTRRPDDK